MLFANVVDPDPNPYWECGSGSRTMKIYQNLQINLVFCLSKRLLYLRMYVFRLITYFMNIFHVKIQLFCDFKVCPGSGSGSAWIRNVLASGR
jgi:hypothetical protein